MDDSMGDAVPSPPAVPGEPRGGDAVDAAWFAGIAEGPVADPAAIQAAVADLNRLALLGPGRDLAVLELDRARYSVWFREDWIPGGQLPVDLHRAILEPMQRIAAATAAGGMESTVRWTLLRGDRVSECLLAPVGGGVAQLRAVERERAATPSDRPPEPFHAAPRPRRKLWQLAGIVLVAILASIALRMQHRWFAPHSDQLVVDPSAVRGIVEVDWDAATWPGVARYRLRLTPSALDPGDAAGPVDVVLSSASGQILATQRVVLARGPTPLPPSVLVELPLHRSAATVKLLPALPTPRDG